MKKRNFWTILLLISISFSILNGFFIQANEKDSCSLSEYVSEFSQTNDCGDLCDLRHMFYISFILPDAIPMIRFDNHNTSPRCEQQFCSNKYTPFTFRPPIAA